MHVSYHIGAHGILGRCINILLNQNREELAANHIVAPRKKHYKELLRPFLKQNTQVREVDENLEILHDALIFEDRCENLVFSDSGFVCGRNGIFRNGIFYPRLEQRVEALDELFPQDSISLHFSIECMSTFVSDLAAESPPRKIGQIAGLPLGAFSWFEVIMRVRESLPRAEVVVWVSEDFYHTILDIFRALTHHRWDGRTRGLHRAESVFLRDEQSRDSMMASEIWEPREIQAVREQYQDDINSIACLDGVTVIRKRQTG